MFEKFTERSRKLMSLARQEAQRLNCEFIGTEHMLLAITQEGGGIAAKVLKNLNVDPSRLRREIDQLITPSTSPAVTLGQLPFSPRAKRAIELAGEAAAHLGHEWVGSEHLLIGLMEETEGIASQAIEKMGLKASEVRDMVLDVLGARAKEAAPAITASEPLQVQFKTIPAGTSLSWDESVANSIVDTWVRISGAAENIDLLKKMITAALERAGSE